MRLGAFFTLLALAGVLPGTVAMPAYAASGLLWVEARLEPAQVAINAQADYVLRFGYAVDVRAPELLAPVARLAEVRPLGDAMVSEATRDGRRYRVVERRFAVLPFASGQIELVAEARGMTPAAVREAGPGGRFALKAPALSLEVVPATASADADWLPARAVRVELAGEPPERYSIGGVWPLALRIEADGVDGSAIPPLRLPIGADSPDWRVEIDPGTSATRIDGRQVVGTRRHLLRIEARRPGALVFPALTVAWWDVGRNEWRRTSTAPRTVEVGGRLPGKPATGIASAPRLSMPWITVCALLLAAAGVAVLLGRGAINKRMVPFLRRLRVRRELLAACQAGDAPAARRALLAWLGSDAGPLPHLEAAAQRAVASGLNDLAAAIRALECALYSAAPPPWNGEALRRALPARHLARRRADANRHAVWHPEAVA